MGSFLVSSLISLVSMNGGVPTGYALQSVIYGFAEFKSAYNSEDLRQDKAKFARDRARKEKKQEELNKEYLYSKATSDYKYRNIESNLRRLEKDILGK